MHHPPDDHSALSEPSTASHNSTKTGLDTQQFRTGFSPLHSSEHNCLLGFRSDAQASELYDEAMQRQHAVLGLLCALSGTPNLNELSGEPLNGCIQAIRLLCNDSAGLYSAAWGRVRQEAA